MGPINYPKTKARILHYSLPNYVVTANNTNIFKRRLDAYRRDQDIIYDFRAQYKEPEVVVEDLDMSNSLGYKTM